MRLYWLTGKGIDSLGKQEGGYLSQQVLYEIGMRGNGVPLQDLVVACRSYVDTRGYTRRTFIGEVASILDSLEEKGLVELKEEEN